MLLDHAERDRVLDLEPVADVGEVLAAQDGRRRGARQRGAAPLRRRDPRRHPRRPARGARRQPARRPDAVPRGEGAGGARRRATTRCPDDVQALAGSVLAPPAAAGARAPAPTSAPRSCATRWSGSRRSDGLMRPRGRHGAARPGAAAWRPRPFDTPSLYVPGRGADGCSPLGAAVLGRAGRARRRGRRAMPGPHTVVEEEPYPLRIEVRARRAAAARRRAARAAARLAGADRRALVAPACGSTCASRAAAARVLEPARLVIRDPLRLFARELVGRRRATRCWCCRASSRSPRRAAAARARARTAASASTPGVPGRRLDASAAELEIDGAAPLPRGRPGVAHPLADGGAARRDARAAARRRARLGAAGRARPVDARRARRRSTWRCAPRRRCASTSARAAAARCCCRASAARSRSGTTWAAWPAVHARLALVEEGPAPPAVVARARAAAR